MKRLEEMERRLENWARWKHSMRSGGLGYATLDLLLANEGSHDRQARIPTIDVEASVTDEGIQQLPNEERYAVHVFYLQASGHQVKARILSCSVATMYTRVARGHHRLRDWLAERACRSRDERERIERLQASARPHDPR